MGLTDSYKDTIQLLKNTFVVIGKNPAIFRPTTAQIILFSVLYVFLVGSVAALFFVSDIFWIIALLVAVLSVIIIGPFFPYIKIYYNAAQCWIVYHTFTGHNISYQDGKKRANENKKDIFLIGTIDIILTAVARKLKQGTGKGGLWMILNIILKILAKGIEEGWDLIGHYLLPACIIQDKSVREVLPDIKNIKNNVPGALVGVFGIDFAGSLFLSLLGFFYILLIIVGLVVGIFLETWIPLIIIIVLLFGINVIVRIFVDMIKTVYFTIFYVALTMPMKIPEQYRMEVTNYLLHKELQKPAPSPATPQKQTTSAQGKNVKSQSQKSVPQQQPVAQTNVSPVGANPDQALQAGAYQKPASAQNPQPSQGQQNPQIDPAAMKLLKYIRQYRQQGHKDDEIMKFLVQHKWPEDVVRKALKYR